jgi:hypothetical protein
MLRKSVVMLLALCLLGTNVVSGDDDGSVPVSGTQHVFSGRVVATTAVCPPNTSTNASTDQPTCSRVTGTVVVKFCVPGATVSEIIVCQDGTGGPAVVISTDVQQINPETCSFSDVVPNRCKGNNCAGHTNCSALLVVNTPTDPGWSTCTGQYCPSP